MRTSAHLDQTRVRTNSIYNLQKVLRVRNIDANAQIRLLPFHRQKQVLRRDIIEVFRAFPVRLGENFGRHRGSGERKVEKARQATQTTAVGVKSIGGAGTATQN